MKTIKRTNGVAAIASVALLSGLLLAGCSDDTPDAEPTPTPDVTETLETPTLPVETFTTREVTDGRTTFTQVINVSGPTLSFTEGSGVEILEVDGLAFLDRNGNGALDVWEDWRLDSMTRASALAAELSIEQLSGLFLFGPHEFGIADGLSENQIAYIGDGHVRAVLHAGDNNITDSVRWVNQMQAFAEGLDGMHIPVILASDPRSTPWGGHTLVLDPGHFATVGGGDVISQWPENLGIAATHDADLVEQMAAMQAREYRAMGISWALGPQVDLASDPRWGRNWQTFGEDVDMSAAMNAAFVRGMQAGGVATTSKHFPADGAGEGGRVSASLDGSGAFSVFPGGAQQDHVDVFLAAMDSGAIMLSFATDVDEDGNSIWDGGDAWPASYNPAVIDLLRDKGYEGVIMTDWFVPADPDRAILGQGRRWFVENPSWYGDGPLESYYIIAAGVDMFGGISNLQSILDAYDVWAERHGDDDADARWRQTGTRVLNMIFDAGLFENPFLDLEESLTIAGSQEKMDAGIAAQLASVVMLKNDDIISPSVAADLSDLTVYIPSNYSRAFNWQTDSFILTEGPALNVEMVEGLVGRVVIDEAVLNAEGDAVEEFLTPDLSDVDLIIVGMTTPNPGGGFNPATGEFFPRSLQWRPYTADGPNVRRVSLAGRMLEDGTRENRSYFGATGTVDNENHLDTLVRVHAAVQAAGRDIPIIVALHGSGPGTFVPTEIYELADAIIIGYLVAQQALVEIALGLHEPAGRLPIGLPASMDAVEASYEDVGRDHDPFVDSDGNRWEFGFGLNFSGPIG
ncbi:MAG: glycoside hydrolase family 3 protein [Promicromonosporaceae bacterium]|nr:glycoside hydrolase family 3 protein [Promicromonosporaceae bacterium]